RRRIPCALPPTQPPTFPYHPAQHRRAASAPTRRDHADCLSTAPPIPPPSPAHRAQRFVHWLAPLHSTRRFDRPASDETAHRREHPQADFARSKAPLARVRAWPLRHLGNTAPSALWRRVRAPAQTLLPPASIPVLRCASTPRRSQTA